MQLRQIKQALRDQVLAARFVPVFRLGQQRDPVLARYRSLFAVFAVLGDSSVHRWAEREALTRSLLREQQRAPGPFWSSVLALAYMPMLQNLRGRLCGDVFHRPDFDQLVLVSFFETVDQLSLERHQDRTAMHLRQDTERRVFRALKSIHRQHKLCEALAQEAIYSDLFPIFEPHLRRARLRTEDREELIELLSERAEGVIDRKKLTLVIDTFLRGVKLRDVAVAQCKSSDEQLQERAYQRLKRQRLRTLERLRPLLSPPDPSEALP